MLTIAALTALGAPVAVAQAQQAEWPELSQGSNGLNVQAAQHLLSAAGHDLTTDGVYGQATASTVTDFQTANGLDGSGVIDAETWAALTVETSSGDQGDAVVATQTLLDKHGAALTLDGSFGAQTQTAVEDFQTDAGLNATGVVNPNTWKHLTGLAGADYVLPLARDVMPRERYERPHHDYPAIDLYPLPEGNDVFAAHGGTVELINDSLCGIGVAVENGADGARYAYCHFWTQPPVFDGQVVEAGQKIGESGDTGNSSEPHLHFGIFVDGVSVCPQELALAIYDGREVPHPSTLPTSGCTF